MHDSDKSAPKSNAPLWLAAGAAAGVLLGLVLINRGGRGRRLLKRIRSIADAIGSIPIGDDAAEDPETDTDDDLDESVDSEADRIDVRVLAAFEQDPRLAVREIEIDEPEPATIVLRGLVPSEDDAEHAETIAHGVPGVSHVENRLKVRPQAHRRALRHDRGAERAPAERPGA